MAKKRISGNALPRRRGSDWHVLIAGFLALGLASNYDLSSGSLRIFGHASTHAGLASALVGPGCTLPGPGSTLAGLGSTFSWLGFTLGLRSTLLALGFTLPWPGCPNAVCVAMNTCTYYLCGSMVLAACPCAAR